MRALSALILAGLLVTPAFAGEEAPAAKPEGKEPKKETNEPGTNVEMPFLIAPMNGPDGKLVAYAYISAKLISATPGAAVGIRDKTPFLQDAFIRDVNGTPINPGADPLKVDQPALIAHLLADAKRIVGAGKVVNYVITQMQIAPSKPQQS